MSNDWGWDGAVESPGQDEGSDDDEPDDAPAQPVEQVEKAVEQVDDTDVEDEGQEEPDVDNEAVEADDEQPVDVSQEALEEVGEEVAEESDTPVPTVNGSTHGRGVRVKTAGEDADRDAMRRVKTSDIAPDALTTEEAAGLGHRWKIMTWGPPGLFKTHFGWTMPEPICYIDTEWKAHDIAHKFEDRITLLFQPRGYSEAKQALHNSIDVLDRFYDESGAVGTIVVDSMSIMWDWAQQHYVDEWFPDAQDVADVEFKSAMQSKDGAGDWKQIKRYHNNDFREVMLDTPYHLYWTATPTEDYSAVISDDLNYTPMRPAGEKDNVHKVDQIIRARRTDDGVPVGDLYKPGIVRYGYRGLEYPTFPKHREVIEDILDAEAKDEPVPVDEITDYDVEVTQGVIHRG